MKILHVNDKNIHKLENEINSYFKNGKHVFVLVYMVGCGHCEVMRPEWAKIESVLNKNPVYNKNNDIVIIDIDGANKSSLNLGEINGFPSMKYIKNGKIEEYAGDRTLDAFIPWIETNSEIDVVNIKDSPFKMRRSIRQIRKSGKSRNSGKSRKSGKSGKSGKSRKSRKSRK